MEISRKWGFILSLFVLIMGSSSPLYASCEGGIVASSFSGAFTVSKIETPKYTCKLTESSQYRDKYTEVSGPGCVAELKVVKVKQKIKAESLPIRVYLNETECVSYKVGQKKDLKLQMREGECCSVLTNAENSMLACTDGPNAKLVKTQSEVFHRCIGAKSSWTIH